MMWSSGSAQLYSLPVVIKTSHSDSLPSFICTAVNDNVTGEGEYCNETNYFCHVFGYLGRDAFDDQLRIGASGGGLRILQG